MMDLSKTIDRIIEIEPNLSPRLISIKERWEKKPNKLHWKKFLDILNVEIPPQHAKRTEIQKVLIPKKRNVVKKYSFESPTPVETEVGVIPEHMEGRLRRLDLTQIEFAKKSVEARMTHDSNLMLQIIRKMELLEIEQRKIWIDLKDHFSLWGLDGPINYMVRMKNNTLILTCIRQQAQGPQQPPVVSSESGENFIIKMDSEMLKKFFKFFNLPFPPGMTE
jgi:hypothetical protein